MCGDACRCAQQASPNKRGSARCGMGANRGMGARRSKAFSAIFQIPRTCRMMLSIGRKVRYVTWRSSSRCKGASRD